MLYAHNFSCVFPQVMKHCGKTIHFGIIPSYLSCKMQILKIYPVAHAESLELCWLLLSLIPTSNCSANSIPSRIHHFFPLSLSSRSKQPFLSSLDSCSSFLTLSSIVAAQQCQCNNVQTCREIL